MKIKHYLVAVALLPFLCGCITEPQKPVESLSVGDGLPQFSIVMSDGTVVDNASLKDNVSVITFFRTTCPDCQREFPVLQQTKNEFPAVRFIMVSVGEGEESVGKYWVENDLTLAYSAQTDKAVANTFKVGSIPQVYICDRFGIVRYVHSDNPVAAYDQLIEELNYLTK